MNNRMDNDPSEQAGPDAQSALPDAVDVEIERRFNKFRREILANQSKNIDRWQAGISGGLAIIGILIALVGYISFERFREIEKDAKASASSLIEEIKVLRGEAKRYTEVLRLMTSKRVDVSPEIASFFLKSVRDNPNASLIEKIIVRAVSLQREGKKAAAIESWRTIAAVSEESDKDLAANAWFSVGYLIEDKEPAAKISAYDEAIRLKPDFAEAYNNRGIAHDALGQDKKAIDDFNEVIRLKPDFAEPYNNRGILEFDSEQYEKAIDDFSEAIRLKPDYAEAYFNRGKANTGRNQYGEAIADYEQAIGINPQDAAAYFYLGIAHGALEEHEKAIVDFSEVIRLNPQHAPAYYNRGRAYKISGDNEKVRADLQRALDLAGEKDNQDLAQAARRLLDELPPVIKKD